VGSAPCAAPSAAERDRLAVHRRVARSVRHDQHRNRAELRVADTRHQVETFAVRQLDLHQHEDRGSILDQPHRILGIRRVLQLVATLFQCLGHAGGQLGALVDVEDDRAHRVSSLSRALESSLACNPQGSEGIWRGFRQE
jgi:hypothetical protein